MTMKTYRRSRLRMNDRLVRADKKGRLGEELQAIEREANRWWAQKETIPKFRHKIR